MVEALDAFSIAVLADDDPESLQSLSGWPAGVLGAVRELVGRGVPMDTTPTPLTRRVATLSSAGIRLRPGHLRDPHRSRRRLWTVAQSGRPMLAARALAARRLLAGAGPLDGLIQIGAEYRAPAGLRMVTFQDSTMVQAVRAYPWGHLRGLSAADVARHVRRQHVTYRSAVGYCAATHWAAESLTTDYGLPAERVHIVGLGANLTVKADPHRDWSRPRFLFVGGDWHRKNGGAVLAAFARVRESLPDATLDLVGGHPPVGQAGVVAHGPRRLDQEIDRHYVARLYRTATAFVMPSRHEPFGAVYTEAANAGIASIGSTNGGAATCIGDAGILVDPSDLDRLVHAMCELARPEVAQALGERAAQRAKLFTWRKVAERLVRALQLPSIDPTELADFL